MGNSLILGKNDKRENVILDGTGDKYLLNKSINDFFKNRRDPLSHGTIDNAPGYDATERGQLKEILKNPMWARGCCSLENTVPIALPYVYPYNGSSNEVKTAYPRILLNKDLKNMQSICAAKFNKKIGTEKLNMYPRDDKVNTHRTTDTKLFISDKATQCGLFYGAKNKDEFDRNNGRQLGLCERVFNKRKREKPNNMYFQMYGNSTKKIPRQLKKIGDDGKEFPVNVPEGYNNDYPECNCINSQFLRTNATTADSVGGMTAKSLNSKQAAIAQQKSDQYCAKDNPGAYNAYVANIRKENISFCLNVANNIKALAMDDSKIKIEQNCNANINKAANRKAEQSNKAGAMDAEDNKATEAAQRAAREANQKLVNEAKERLKEQQALADKARKEREEYEEKRKKEEEERRKEDERRRKEDQERREQQQKMFEMQQKQLQAALARANEVKTLPPSTGGSNNMMVIGIGLLVVVVLVIILMMSMGGKKAPRTVNRPAVAQTIPVTSSVTPTNLSTTSS